MKRLLILLVLSFWLLSVNAIAATYYIATNGTGTKATCTSSGLAASSLCPISYIGTSNMQPGEVWYLKNGTYTSSGGVLRNCASSGVASGISGSPITIQAENERQAYISLTGSQGFKIDNCAYINVVGLRVSGTATMNTSGSAVTAVMTAHNSSNILFKRNLVHTCDPGDSTPAPVAPQNLHCMSADHSTAVTYEENEFYDYYRYAIFDYVSNGSIVRRNYCNSRHYALNYGQCIIMYPSSNLTAMNNIAEETGGVFHSLAGGAINTNNKAFGNIAYNTTFGVGEDCHTDAHGNPTNFVAVDNVFKSSQSDALGGFLFAWSTGARIENNSSWAAPSWGFSQTPTGDGSSGCGSGSGNPNITGKNNLVYGAGTGFIMTGTWSLFNSNAASTSTPYSPTSGDSRYNGYAHTDSVSAAQLLCPGFIIPGSTNLKGTGQGGADIGADASHYYDASGNKLSGSANLVFSPTTRAVNFAGATVSGINSSNALIDFHTRFHPTCALENFPSNITVSITIPPNNGTLNVTASPLSLGGTSSLP